MPFDTLFDDVVSLPPPSQGEAPEGGPPLRKLLPAGGGVYLLTDAADRIIQLASAASFRRTLAARLADRASEQGDATTASASRRADLRAVARKVWLASAFSAFETNWRYWRIARALYPKRYLKMLGFGPAWFVRADVDQPAPDLVASKIIGPPGELTLGPLPRRRDAERLIAALQDAFDLCRYHAILQQAPSGQPCAYRDMGKCPAPCDGSIPMDEYRAMLRQAVQFACGDRRATLERWDEQMRAAAGRMDYERAASFKQRIDRTRTLDQPAFAQMRDLRDLDYLVVQRGSRPTRVRPFFVRRGIVRPGRETRLKDLPAHTEDWLREVRNDAGEPLAPAAQKEAVLQEVSEQIWLVSHFLFKKDAPGLFLRPNECGSAAVLAERVAARFARPAKDDSDPAPDAPGHEPKRE